MIGFPFAFAVGRALIYFVVVSAVIGLDLVRVSWVGLALVLLSAAAAFSAVAIAAGAAALLLKRVEAILP